MYSKIEILVYIVTFCQKFPQFFIIYYLNINLKLKNMLENDRLTKKFSKIFRIKTNFYEF